MTTIVALGFPILVVAAAWAVFRPGDVARRFPARTDADRSPVPYRTHLAATVPYLAVAFAVGWALARAQHALLAGASGSASWAFSERTTDRLVYAMIPGLFLGLVVTFAIGVRALHAHFGDRLGEMIDRRGRDRTGLSLRQEIALFPRLATGIAVATVLLNAAAFDSFFQVGERVFRFSGFFSPRTSEYSVAEIRELAVYAQRVAPNGRTTDKSFLEIRMRNGEAIDTYYLIEQRQIPEAITALQHAARGALRVVRYDHAK